MRYVGQVIGVRLIQTKEHVTGASNRPVKNFLMHLAATICAGVTGGSFTHGLPATKNKYIHENTRKPLNHVYYPDGYHYQND